MARSASVSGGCLRSEPRCQKGQRVPSGWIVDVGATSWPPTSHRPPTGHPLECKWAPDATGWHRQRGAVSINPHDRFPRNTHSAAYSSFSTAAIRLHSRNNKNLHSFFLLFLFLSILERKKWILEFRFNSFLSSFPHTQQNKSKLKNGIFSFSVGIVVERHHAGTFPALWNSFVSVDSISTLLFRNTQINYLHERNRRNKSKTNQNWNSIVKPKKLKWKGKKKL